MMVSQPLPESIHLLRSVCSEVMEDKITRAMHDSQNTMGQVIEYSSNLRRKDYCGKLKELIHSKYFTYPFIFKKKLTPCMFLLETIGDNKLLYTCVIPTLLEIALVNKDFFTEGDVYLFSNLSICVTKSTPSIFFVVTSRTRSRYVLT